MKDAKISAFLFKNIVSTHGALRYVVTAIGYQPTLNYDKTPIYGNWCVTTRYATTRSAK